MVNKVKPAALIIILITVLIMYAPVLKAPFIYDDVHLIANNELIASFKYIPKVFNLISRTNAYELPARPLQILSYMIDYKSWKLNPSGYHLINILLHVLNGFLIYKILIRFVKKEKKALLVTRFL